MEMEWEWDNEGMIRSISPRGDLPPTHTVIILHGRGDNARDFRRGLQQDGTWTDAQGRSLMQRFPTFRWVFPDAGQKPCVRRDGPPTMSQWFDMWDARNLRYREELQAPGLQDSVARIRQLIRAEAKLLGWRYDKIILMGISQGGATSVHTLLNLYLPPEARARRLGAFVGIACRMPFPERSLADTRRVLGLDGDRTSATSRRGSGSGSGSGTGGGGGSGADSNTSEVLQNTPMMLQHCIDDPLVLVESGRQLRATLGRFGASVLWKEYPQGGHWFKSPDGIEDLAQFLARVLPRA